jgi:hypothetical protein
MRMKNEKDKVTETERRREQKMKQAVSLAQSHVQASDSALSFPSSLRKKRRKDWTHHSFCHQEE